MSNLSSGIQSWSRSSVTVRSSTTRRVKPKLASRVPGSVWRVFKNVGDKVSKGEVLVVVDAVGVGDLKTLLLRSLAEENLQQQNVSRLTKARSAIAGARVLDAEAALAKARADVLSAEQSLRNLGLPVDVKRLRGMDEEQVLDELRFIGIPSSIRSQLDAQSATANLLPLSSPMDGIVIERTVTPGEVVDPSRMLFQIGDTRQMWLQLSVPLENMNQLAHRSTHPIHARWQSSGRRRCVGLDRHVGRSRHSHVGSAGGAGQ